MLALTASIASLTTNISSNATNTHASHTHTTNPHATNTHTRARYRTAHFITQEMAQHYTTLHPKLTESELSVASTGYRYYHSGCHLIDRSEHDPIGRFVVPL